MTAPTPLLAPEILQQAQTTMQLRAASRDLEQERSMARAIRIFNATTDHKLTEHDGWTFMVCLKQARAQIGKFDVDDYVDGAAYMALAGECAGTTE